MKDKTDQNQKGRGTEINPASIRHTFRMTEKENADFLTLMEKSGLKKVVEKNKDNTQIATLVLYPPCYEAFK